MDEDEIERLVRGEFVSRHEFPNTRTVDEMVELGFLDYDEEGLLTLGELAELHLELTGD